MAETAGAVDKGVSFLTALGIALAAIISDRLPVGGLGPRPRAFNWFYVIYALCQGTASFGT